MAVPVDVADLPARNAPLRENVFTHFADANIVRTLNAVVRAGRTVDSLEAFAGNAVKKQHPHRTVVPAPVVIGVRANG